MALIKVKLKTSNKNKATGTICYQIIHNRLIKTVVTDHKLSICEWDINSESILLTRNKTRNIELNQISEQINLDTNRIRDIINNLETHCYPYTVAHIANQFKIKQNVITLFDFTEKVITTLKKEHKIRTIETYTTTLNSFKRFRNGADIPLIELDSLIIMNYESYLYKNNISKNTISFYMRALRAIYYRAADQNLVLSKKIFKRVYTGIDKTAKRAISLQKIKEISNLDLSNQPKLDFARDMFLFSFYTRGMSFIDMAYLQKKDIYNKTITYRRRKTGQTLHIKWEESMQDILNKYPPNNTVYLLPIITDTKINIRADYQKKLSRINAQLKKISKLISLHTPLTMYVARHSWASIAKHHNIPISVISEGMGHYSEKTTQIYLASLDNGVIDKANSMILKLLR